MTEGTRTYKSALREAQRAQTRQKLLDAFGDLVREGGGDVTLPQVARRAGVTPPTAYNHFATIEAIADAFFVQPGIDFTPASLPGVDDLLQLPRALFARFDDEELLIRQFNALRGDAQVRLTGRQARNERMLPMFRSVFGELPPETERLAPILIRHLIGSKAWTNLKHHLGVSSPEAARLTAWLIALIVAELERDPGSLERFEAP